MIFFFIQNRKIKHSHSFLCGSRKEKRAVFWGNFKLEKILFYIVFVCLCSFSTMGQTTTQNTVVLQGEVKEKESGKPIANAEVITAIDYALTNAFGHFTIRAVVGQEIEFRSFEFLRVTHIVSSADKITVLVEENKSAKKIKPPSFLAYIDSAKAYTSKDIRKSIAFIERALQQPAARKAGKNQAIAYQTLGDIYMFHKQFDLAVSNYNLSYNKRATFDVKLSWIKALHANRQYMEAEILFREKTNNLNKLSAIQQSKFQFEKAKNAIGLKQYDRAIKNLTKALSIAKDNGLQNMVLLANKELGVVYGKKNENKNAEKHYNASLVEAEQSNSNRTIELQYEVADFYNENNAYTKEIELRKQSLVAISKKKTSKENMVLGVRQDSITSQKLNYKIASAYLAQQEYDKAIPFLEKSIKEASEKEDVVIQKDATRKLSEIYKYKGVYDKSLETYQRYVALVDTLYHRKEQEISKLAKLHRDILQQQRRIDGLEEEWQLQQTKYNLAIKDQELIQVASKRKQWFIYVMLGGLSLLGVIAFLGNRSLKQERKANRVLALKSLRTQMNPHFIFNALNSVNSFIAQSDERKANKFISDFSKLMRSVLENSELDLISLRKEIELLRLYVKLEHSRFQEVFDYVFEVDENIDLEDFTIPPMLLQPYLENAIWHGLRYRESKGVLRIRFQKHLQDCIQISISDDGIGRKASKIWKTENQKKKKSKGMENVRARVGLLNKVYGEGIQLQVNDLKEDGSGTVVQIILRKNLKGNG